MFKTRGHVGHAGRAGRREDTFQQVFMQKQVFLYRIVQGANQPNGSDALVEAT